MFYCFMDSKYVKAYKYSAAWDKYMQEFYIQHNL